jgi:hypothetical protein
MRIRFIFIMRKLHPIKRFFGYSTMDFGTDSDVAQPSGRIPALRSTPRAVLYSNCAAKTRNQQSNRRRERKRRTPETVAHATRLSQYRGITGRASRTQAYPLDTVQSRTFETANVELERVPTPSRCG